MIVTSCVPDEAVDVVQAAEHDVVLVEVQVKLTFVPTSVDEVLEDSSTRGAGPAGSDDPPPPPPHDVNINTDINEYIIFKFER